MSDDDISKVMAAAREARFKAEIGKGQKASAKRQASSQAARKTGQNTRKISTTEATQGPAMKAKFEKDTGAYIHELESARSAHAEAANEAHRSEFTTPARTKVGDPDLKRKEIDAGRKLVSALNKYADENAHGDGHRARAEAKEIAKTLDEEEKKESSWRKHHDGAKKAAESMRKKAKEERQRAKIAKMSGEIGKAREHEGIAEHNERGADEIERDELGRFA